MRLTFEQFCRINDLVNGATRLIDIEEIAADIEQDSGSLRVTIDNKPAIEINSDGYVIRGDIRMTDKKYRVLRVLEYVGDKDWVDRQIENRTVKGTRIIAGNGAIREAVLGDVAELLDSADAESQKGNSQ